MTFTDGDSNAEITATSTNVFFYVIKIAASPPITQFRVQFDPDGYGTSDYNEVENTVTDKIVTIEEVSATIIATVEIREFQDILVPVCFTLIMVTMVYKRKKKKHLTGSVLSKNEKTSHGQN